MYYIIKNKTMMINNKIYNRLLNNHKTIEKIHLNLINHIFITN